MHRSFFALLLTPFAFVSAVELPPLPEAVTSFGAVVSEGQLYTYGGHLSGSHDWSKDTTNSKLQRLNLSKPEKWESLTTGPAVQSPGLAESEGKIYLVGGMQPQNAAKEPPVLKSLTHAAYFTPATGTWTKLPDLPEPRSSHDIAIMGGKLYVVGGWPLDSGSAKAAPDDRHAERPFHSTMLVLDLAKPEKWEVLPQPFQRRAIALVAAGGKLYSLGGMTSKNEVVATANVYDLASGKWSDLPDLPVAGKMKAFGSAACAVDGRVIASPSGGKVFALSSDEKSWAEAGDVRESRFFHQLEPWTNNQVIVLGGTKGGDPLASLEIITLTTSSASVSAR